MKKSSILVLLIFSFLFFVPLIKADMITPGYRILSIEHRITNINDFPDYVFVSTSGFESSIKIIDKTGLIRSCEDATKSEGFSVFALKKENLSASMNELNRSLTYYFEHSSPDIKRVIVGSCYESIKSSSIIRPDKYYYTIDLNATKHEPDKVVKSITWIHFFLPLILTFLIEWLIIFGFINKSTLRIVIYIFLINLLTWSCANLILNFYPSFFVVELLVILAESFLYMYALKLKYRRALLISVVANGITGLIGFLFYWTVSI